MPDSDPPPNPNARLGHRLAQRLESVSAHLTQHQQEPANSAPQGIDSVVASEKATSPQQSTIRRIVTDHNPDGKAIIASDAVLSPTNPLDPNGGPTHGSIPGFTNIFSTTSHPACAQGAWSDPHGQRMGLVGSEGVVCRIVDFPSVADIADEDVNIMHRTLSVDYGVILQGQIELVLDDGLSTTMRQGDVVVQRGTVHHWRNTSGEVCRVFFVLVPAKPIVVEKTGEVLRATDTKRIENKSG